MNNYSANLGALQAFGQGVNVTAHNLANVNTSDFRAWSRSYGEGTRDSGPEISVRVGGTSPSVQDELSLSPFLVSPETGPGAGPGAGTGAGQEAGQQTPEIAAGAPDLGLGKNTVDIGREMTNLISDQRAFEANAVTISTRDDMDASLLGMVTDQQV